MPVVLAAIPAVMGGLLALLLLFGIILVVDLFLRSIDTMGIPGFFANPLKAAIAGLARAVSSVTNFFAMIGRHALSIFSVPAMGFVGVINTSVIAFARLGGWIRWLVHDAVPSLWNGLFTLFAQAINTLTAYASHLFSQAITLIHSIRTTLERALAAAAASLTAYSLSLFRIAINALNAAMASVSAYAFSLFRLAQLALANAVTRLSAYIISVYQQLTQYINQVGQWAVNTAIGISIDWARKYTDQVIDLYNRAIGAAGALAMAPAWPHILNAIDSISLALPGSIAAILDRLGAIPRAIPRDIAGSLGAVATIGAIGLDWVARCGVPLCRNVLGFGDELASLEEELIIADLLSVIAGAISDPRDTARDVINVMSAPLATMGREFVGVIESVE